MMEVETAAQGRSIPGRTGDQSVANGPLGWTRYGLR